MVAAGREAKSRKIEGILGVPFPGIINARAEAIEMWYRLAAARHTITGSADEDGARAPRSSGSWAAAVMQVNFY